MSWSRILENTSSDDGGGLSASHSTLNIHKSKILENSCSDDGGGLYVVGDSRLSSTSNIVAENIGCAGGGMFLRNSPADISNCLVLHNSTRGNGGGFSIYKNDHPINIVNSTVTRNMSDGGTGGCYLYDSYYVTILNSIFWGNEGAEIEGYGASVSYSDIHGGYPGIGNINEPPRFVDEPGLDYHLLPDSPCIDSGTDSGIDIDYEGDPRPVGAGYDMGADEYGLFLVEFKELTGCVEPGYDAEGSFVIRNLAENIEGFDECLLIMSGSLEDTLILHEGIPVELEPDEEMEMSFSHPVPYDSGLGICRLESVLTENELRVGLGVAEFLISECCPHPGVSATED